ncbi:MAG: cell division protein ZapA [Oscillospiraceae bacterium]
MQNRVTVTVGGLKYTLLASEGEDYVHRVAAYVNEKLKETGRAGGISQMDCAVLTAINIADERFKEQEASENLRRQIKDLLEESAKLKSELSECKREIFKLQQKR